MGTFLLADNDHENAHDLVSRLREQMPLDKVVRKIELVDGRATIFFFWKNEPIVMSRMFCELSRGSKSQSTLAIAQAIKSFLLEKPRQQSVLIIDSKGNSSLMYGVAAVEAIAQVEMATLHHKFVEGPCPLALLADFAGR